MTQALRELSAARQTLPNNSRVLRVEWLILSGVRDDGKKRDEKLGRSAVQLDPRNIVQLLQQIALTIRDLRQFDEEAVAIGA